MKPRTVQWYALVSTHMRAKTVAILGPFPTQEIAEHQARDSGCGYWRVSTRP